MKETEYNKLVRDRIPEIIENNGQLAVCEVLPEQEYLKMLDRKLTEELQEYLSSGEVEELADLLEVIYAAARARGTGSEELEQIRRRKAEKRGGFEKRIFLKRVVQK